MRVSRNRNPGDTRASLRVKTDGLPIGQRPESGVFQGNFFIHPDLNFKIHFPSGWNLQNSNLAVGATNKEGDAAIFLKAEQLRGGGPQEVAEAWLAKNQEGEKLEVNESQAAKVGRIDAWRLGFSAGGYGRSIAGLVTLFPYAEGTWSITGMAPGSLESRDRGRTLSTTHSFTPLTEEERNSLSGMRLRHTQARPGDSIQRLSERSGNAWNVTDTAIYNAIFVDHNFKGGEWVKISKTEAYIPKPLPPAGP
jgi:predicted Zn-dependent protease